MNSREKDKRISLREQYEYDMWVMSIKNRSRGKNYFENLFAKVESDKKDMTKKQLKTLDEAYLNRDSAYLEQPGYLSRMFAEEYYFHREYEKMSIQKSINLAYKSFKKKKAEDKAAPEEIIIARCFDRGPTAND